MTSAWVLLPRIHGNDRQVLGTTSQIFGIHAPTLGSVGQRFAIDAGTLGSGGVGFAIDAQLPGSVVMSFLSFSAMHQTLCQAAPSHEDVKDFGRDESGSSAGPAGGREACVP